jgi:hypothetical protein
LYALKLVIQPLKIAIEPTKYGLNHLSSKMWIARDTLWRPKSKPPNQWEFQDPKMEVLYHIRPYFVGIFPYVGLT